MSINYSNHVFVMARQAHIACLEYGAITVWWAIAATEFVVLKASGALSRCLIGKALGPILPTFVGEFPAGSRQSEIEAAIRAHAAGKLKCG